MMDCTWEGEGRSAMIICHLCQILLLCPSIRMNWKLSARVLNVMPMQFKIQKTDLRSYPLNICVLYIAPSES
jgi:hypothetical protein